jgi:tRNA A37 methylthiotransferase MiaB
VGTFYVENFGCRATQADGAAIERQFRQRGLERAESSAQAEIVVLNTCTVTAAADQDARAAIRRIHRQNAACRIVVTGCYAQRAPEEVAALPGVSQVIGNSHKHVLAQLVPESSPNANAFVPLSQLRTENQELISDSNPTNQRLYVGDIFAHTELLAAPVFDASGQRTRPNLKVQDGCDNRCSFCIIPSVRGQSRSLKLGEVLREVNALVEAGYREVVISGINLGRWGRDLLPEDSHTGAAVPPRSAAKRRKNAAQGASPGSTAHNVRAPQGRKTTPSLSQSFFRSIGADLSRVPHPGLTPWAAFLRRFAADASQSGAASEAVSATSESNRRHGPRFEDLVRVILSETSLQKLRLSSIEPMDWSSELIRLMADSPRIAKHAHVPLQSGSDRILRLMHRKYRPWHYREKIEQIRAAMPTAAIGADVMVGFPGETDADFEATRRLIDDLPFTYLHVFTYSSRPGTPSATMPNQVPVHIARERNHILRDLADRKKLAFMQSFLGKQIEAITLAGATNSLSSRAQHCDSPSESLCGVEGPCVPQAAFTEALTDNYLKLRLQGRYDPNRWITAKVQRVEDGVLVGWPESQASGNA